MLSVYWPRHCRVCFQVLKTELVFLNSADKTDFSRHILLLAKCKRGDGGSTGEEG